MSIDHITEAGRKAKGKRPYFFEDRQAEQVLNIVMAVAGEVAVLRERLDTVERLLDEKGSLRREDIEHFTPDDEAARQRQLWHQEYIARILRIVQQEREAISENAEGQPGMETLVDRLAGR